MLYVMQGKRYTVRQKQQLIKRVLKETFPDTAFDVQIYGRDTIIVKWTDGPSETQMYRHLVIFEEAKINERGKLEFVQIYENGQPVCFADAPILCDRTETHTQEGTNTESKPSRTLQRFTYAP